MGISRKKNVSNIYIVCLTRIGNLTEDLFDTSGMESVFNEAYNST